MPQIIPIRDLKKTSELSKMCAESSEPIFVTKNGYGDMVIMSMKTYEEKLFQLDVYTKLAEAEKQVQNGQVLDALQELTRLAVQSATGERSRLMLDVGGHRAERRASLVTLAKEAIDEVRTSGERKPLTPMTAFERKVVHDEVLAAGLVSESEGAEPRRYVVILPA